MSALGSLVVKLALEYAEYTKGLDKSSQEALKFAQNTQKHFDKANEVTHEFFTGVVKGAAATAAAYIGVSGAVDMFNESIDNLASLDDMAQKTGATVENLSRLQKVAVMTGTEFGNVDGAIDKLAKNMAGIDDESNKTFKALELLGVSSTDTAGKLRDPAEVLIDVAKGLQSYEDGAAKVSIANDLFGKSGADLLPYLNDVNENVDRFTGVSAEAAQKASEMQDRFGALKVQADELKTEFSMALLPAFNDISGAIIDTYKESGKLEAAWIALGGLGTFLFTDDFSSDKQKLAELNDELKSMEIDMKLRQESFGVNGALKRLLFGGYSMEELPKAIEYTRYQIGLLQDKIKTDAAPKPGTKPNIDLGKSRAEEEAEKEAKARADRLKRDQESQIKQREKFIEGLEKEAATLSMTAAQSKVYEAAQIGITGRELDKVKALTRSIEAHKANEKAIADELKISQEHAAQNLEFSNSLDKNVDALRSQVEAQRDYNERLGLSQSAIRSLNSEEIERQAIAKESLASLMDQIDWTGQLGDKYREEARLLRELNALKNEGIDTQNGIDRVNQSLREQSDMWASIDRTAHDTFVSMWDNGKDAAQRLKDTFKNVFFDWLYQMTVKKWIVNVSAGVSGNASGGSGGGSMDSSSMINAGKSLWDGFSSSGSVGGGIANVAGNYIGQFGSLIGSQAVSAFASGLSGTAVGTMAGSGATIAGSATGLGSMSAAAGAGQGFGVLAAGAEAGSAAGAAGMGAGISSALAAIPVWGWAALAAAAIAAKFGGGKDRVIGDQSISGTLGTNDMNRNVNWTKDGGWFHSDTSGTWNYNLANSTAIASNGQSYQDTANVANDQALLKHLNGTYEAIKEKSAAYASALGLNADAISSRTDSISFALGKTQEEIDKAIQTTFGTIADNIAISVAPGIAQFSKSGETANETMARLASGLIGVNNVIDAMGFDKFASSLGGANSAQKLLDATGGIEKFSATAAYFTDNFLSEADKMKPTIDAVASTLASLGMTNLKSVEDFKLAVVGGVDANGNLVKALDLTSDAGVQTYAKMMDIAPAFKAVADYTEALNSKLATTNQGIQDQIDALTKASLSLEEQRKLETTGVADSTKTLLDRVYALQDEATASALAKAAADKLAATNESLEQQIDALTKASLSLEEQRKQETTGVADSTKNLLERFYALQDEATASALAKAAADKLAATNESLEQQIAALTKASLSLEEQRKLETTGVADSTKTLLDRVYALQDEASALAKAKAATEKLAATNESIQQQIDALVRSNLPLEEQRKLEVVGIDDTTKALKEQFWALQDSERALLEKAAFEKQAADEQIRAEKEAQSAFNSWLGDVKSAFSAESGVLKNVVDQFRRVGDGLRQYRDSLDTGKHALLTKDDQYFANKREWENLLVAIDKNEEGALEKYQAVADAFLDSSRERNASSVDYFRDVDAAKKAADKAAIVAYAQVDVAKLQLNYLEQQVAGLFDINESVKTLAELLVPGSKGSFANSSQSGLSSAAYSDYAKNILANVGGVSGFNDMLAKAQSDDYSAIYNLRNQVVRWSEFDFGADELDKILGKDSLQKTLDLFKLSADDYKEGGAGRDLTLWDGQSQHKTFWKGGFIEGSGQDVIDFVPPKIVTDAGEVRSRSIEKTVVSDEETKALLRRQNELLATLINSNNDDARKMVSSLGVVNQRLLSIESNGGLERSRG